MPIIKTEQQVEFKTLNRGDPFAFTTTLYTRSKYKEDPKEYFMFKLNGLRAVTVDKRTVIHMLGDTVVNVCTREQAHTAK
jgi:hypothetical protein